MLNKTDLKYFRKTDLTNKYDNYLEQILILEDELRLSPYKCYVQDKFLNILKQIM